MAAQRSTATKPRAKAKAAEPDVTVETNGSATLPEVESNGHVEAAAAPVDAPPDTVTPPPEPVFVFQPKDGDPITVPPVLTAIPEGMQRWFFWKLRKLQGLEQPIFWLEQAHISDSVQEKIILLPDEEWSRFFEEWMADGTGGATLGE